MSTIKINAVLIAVLLSFGIAVRMRPAGAASQSPMVQPSATPGATSPESDMSTILMESTFEITGPNASGQSLQGTGFVVGKPSKENPKSWYYVLVTAAHVFDGMTGPRAILVNRVKQGDQWTKDPVSFRIRDNQSKPLWVKNPQADVAAMYFGFPKGTEPPVLVPTGLFSDDTTLKQLEVRPGDRVFILGFPLGFESPTGGFPILRAGWIASYPLIPSRSVGKFLVSFEVFPGNSGGPVYLVDYNRLYQNTTHIGLVHFFVGLVSQSVSETQRQQGLYSTTEQQYPLNVAVVIPASLIADTINLLPARPSANEPNS